MDIDQSARRQARDEFQVIDPDYYDMEGLYIRTNDCIGTSHEKKSDSNRLLFIIECTVV